MFALLICILTLRQVQSECHLKGICTDSTAVQAEIVDRHNALRRAVEPTASDMLRMNYSVEVAASAQAWVDGCILGHGKPSTRMLNGYELGENLFYSSSPYSWTDVINAWYSEVSHYKYPKGSTNGQQIGHYTQMEVSTLTIGPYVKKRFNGPPHRQKPGKYFWKFIKVVWNSSYRVGCGVKLCPNNIYFYGCHYYRAGNFKGWIPYKAGAPCASCPNHCDNKLCTNPCPYINKFLNCPSLKTNVGCSNKLVYGWCPAACKCTDEIIPIA